MLRIIKNVNIAINFHTNMLINYYNIVTGLAAVVESKYIYKLGLKNKLPHASEHSNQQINAVG